mmetsp:Transcript_13801/g.59045  ORF Transcript_13801/g.59045 Transcript_13801/m.59045 type:complete len:292 (+) Transcript_13801:1523-2398(+)
MRLLSTCVPQLCHRAGVYSPAEDRALLDAFEPRPKTSDVFFFFLAFAARRTTTPESGSSPAGSHSASLALATHSASGAAVASPRAPPSAEPSPFLEPPPPPPFAVAAPFFAEEPFKETTRVAFWDPRIARRPVLAGRRSGIFSHASDTASVSSSSTLWSRDHSAEHSPLSSVSRHLISSAIASIASICAEPTCVSPACPPSAARRSHPMALVTCCSSFHSAASSRGSSGAPWSTSRTSTCAHRNTRPGTSHSQPLGSKRFQCGTGSSSGASGFPGPLSVSESNSEYRCKRQ